MFNIGPAELMVIFILALLVFGPKKLPEVSRQIGKGIREFRRASEQIQGEIHGALNLDDADDDEDSEDTKDTPTISANGHSADSATTAAPDAVDQTAPEDDGHADGPASTERTD